MSVTPSTREAEYRYVACADGIKVALFGCAVFEFLQPHLRGRSIVVFEDNEGTKAVAEVPLARSVLPPLPA